MNVTRTVKMYYLHILRKKIRKKILYGYEVSNLESNEQQSIDNNLGLMLS